MARTTGPLMSMEASGTLAKTLVFSKWKGRSYVRSHVIPSNPKSVNQIAVRAMMKFLSQSWKVAPVSMDATWKTPAASLIVSPFNAYVKTNMKLWANFETPSAAYPAALTGAMVTAPTFTAVGGVGQITGTFTQTVDANLWGFAVCVAAGAITPTRSQVRLVQLNTGNTAVDWSITGLVPATYHVNIFAFNSLGVKGVLATADISPTVT